ncbi:MAG: hypothetical protein Kow0047_08850 [Anaerolineae bacterium]
MPSYYHRVPAAERTIRLLEALSRSPAGLSVAELQQELMIPRAALFALLNTLKSLGYVEQIGPRGAYRLTARLGHLSAASQNRRGQLEQLFFHEMTAQPWDETLALVVPEGDDIVVTAVAPGRQVVRCDIAVGHRAPTREAAAGWLFLAARQAERDDDPRVEIDSLPEVRRLGAAVRRRDDVVEVAVPICPDGVRPAAALWALVPAYRYPEGREETLLGMLREAAARLSYRLGAWRYRPYDRTLPGVVSDATPMAADERDAFLGGPWAARLACVRDDGRPHVVPVWYEWTQGAFLVVAWPGSRWSEYVMGRPTVALSVDEPWPPMRRVLAQGRAVAMAPRDLPGGWPGFLERLYDRYLGTSHPGHREAADPSAWRAFRIEPTRLTAYRMAMEGDR